jgi:hypothetical protein
MNPNIYYNLSAENYHKSDGISKSGLDQFRKSPAHYRHWLTAQREETPAMRLGTLTHMSVFQPEMYAHQVVIAPIVDRRTKEGKSIWEQFQIENEGKDIVKHDEALQIDAMTKSVRSQPVIKKMLDTGAAEVSLFAKIDGILMKGRLDYVTNETILDLKTTEDATPSGFSRSVANYRYHVQAAHYLAIGKELGMNVNRFIFIAVEKEAPYAVALYELDVADLMLAEAERQKQIAMLGNCIAFDSWPSYPAEIKTLSLPKWATSNNNQ